MNTAQYTIMYTQRAPGKAPVSAYTVGWTADQGWDMAGEIASAAATAGGEWAVTLREEIDGEGIELASWDHTTHGVDNFGELFELSGPLPCLN